MSDKKSFVMYESWGAAIEKMSNEQAGELIKAIYAYQKDPDAVPEDPALAFVFELIKQQLDADSQRYKDACAARSEAGKKGGRPKINASDKKQMVSEESKKSKCFSEKAKKQFELAHKLLVYWGRPANPPPFADNEVHKSLAM